MSYQVDKVQQANPQWSYGFVCGYVQGKAEALAKAEPDRSVFNASDDYSYGYRSAFASYWQGSKLDYHILCHRLYQES